MKQNAASEGLYKIVWQILEQNSCEVNSKSISEMIREVSVINAKFFCEENSLFSYKNKRTKSNILMELAKSAKDDALRELLVNRQTYRWFILI